MHHHQPLPHRSHLLPLVPVGLVTAALTLGACSTSNQHAQTPAAAESARADALGRLDDAAALVTQAREEIPDDIAPYTRCLVLVPSLKKGSLILRRPVGSRVRLMQDAERLECAGSGHGRRRIVRRTDRLPGE